MSQDPEKRDIDPAFDRVWRVDVYMHVDFPMYVVATSKEEAEECGTAHWQDEYSEGGIYENDADVSPAKEPEKGPIKDPDWADSVPWGRSHYKGKQLKVNEVIELINNPPPLGWPPIYDTQTILMPFVDSPPPLRPEGEE